jgi:hypothetical protein
LKAALLDANDLGPPFTVASVNSTATPSRSSAESRFTGCPELALLLNGSSDARLIHQSGSFSAGDTGPYVAVALTTAPPETLAAADAEARSVLTTCRSLKFSTGSTSLTFTLTPIAFGGPDSAAVRLDAELRGVLVNGYIAVERIDDVELGYAFFQAGEGSSQLAFHYYTKAVDKVRRVL